MENKVSKVDSKQKNKIICFIVLHALLLVYSTSGIFSKLASKEAFLSAKFCLYYGIIIFILVLYAIVWQQILKHIELTTAFSNKSVTIVWGMIWGALIFSEPIKWNMIVGAVIVIVGVIIVVTADE